MNTPPDSTGQKQDTRFKPGESGNPGGRPKGARNKYSEAFVATFAEDFDRHGREAIERVREESPQTYLKVAASLVPKQMELDEKRPARRASEMTDDELADIIAGHTKATR